MVGDVAGVCHDVIAVFHRLRDDDRRHAGGIGLYYFDILLYLMRKFYIKKHLIN
jgi:hypothetical protein